MLQADYAQFIINIDISKKKMGACCYDPHYRRGPQCGPGYGYGGGYGHVHHHHHGGIHHVHHGGFHGGHRGFRGGRRCW